jgi:hypothetical protein
MPPLFSMVYIYIVELVLVEGAWTTRTSSTIYIDYGEKRGHGQREQVLQYI